MPGRDGSVQSTVHTSRTVPFPFPFSMLTPIPAEMEKRKRDTMFEMRSLRKAHARLKSCESETDMSLH